MSPAPSHRDTVAIDIEVVGFPWESLDESTRGYLLSRARTDEERAAVPGKLALYPGCGRVIAIGMWNVEKEAGALLLEGENAAPKGWVARSDSTKVFRGSERDLLAELWRALKEYGRIVTFHGRSYDGPVLMIRSAILGITPSRSFAGNRYQMSAHCDLMEVLSFHGATSERFKLEYWCRRFGIESPKVDLDGSQVGAAYERGEIERIGEYCLRDARATASLYEKLRPTLLRHFTD